MFKPLLISLVLVGAVSAAYPRFQKYEECVAYCDNDPACQSAFWDTISGDCQSHDCIYGRTPPDRFKSYIKAGATEYCPGTSPTASLTTAAPTASTQAATATSGESPAAAESSGAAAGLGPLRMDAVSAAAAVCLAVGLLG